MYVEITEDDEITQGKDKSMMYFLKLFIKENIEYPRQ